MAFKHFPVAALALAMVCSQPVESERDQYENRQYEPHAVRQLSEATDPRLQVDVARRSVPIEKETNGDTAGSSDVDKSEVARAKRGFSRWTGRRAQLPGYRGFSVWKPSTYQLTRPYFIPVYGPPGKVPIYFPPQRLNLNPGTPIDNPLPNRPYQGPGYLPPKEYLPPTTEKPDGIIDKFLDDDDDDRPIWGVSVASTESPSVIVPTRPPRPASMPEFPPLVHDVTRGTNFLSAEESRQQNTINSIQAPRTTTSRPLAVGPSNCAWAIVSCCSASSNVVSDSCFEQRGCPGPFWGASPCNSDYARAAIQSALKYFDQ